MTGLSAILVPAELLAAWVLVSSIGGRGDPWPVVGVIAMAICCHLAGRFVPRPVVPWAALGLGVGIIGAVLVGSGTLADPLAGPLGYANANAALVVQGAAALAVAGWAGPAWLRLPTGVGVVGCLLVCLQVGAVAATVSCAVVLVVMLAVESEGGRRSAVALSVALLVAGSALAFVAGLGVLDGTIGDTFSQRRVTLWQQGVEAIGDRPLLGAGARDFREVSTAAARDADTREAHSEFVQRAAESGFPGLLLELAAVVVVAVALVRRGTPAAACALAGWAALWANAGVDWVLAFPAVVAAGALLSGLGLGRDAPVWSPSSAVKKVTPLVTR